MPAREADRRLVVLLPATRQTIDQQGNHTLPWIVNAEAQLSLKQGGTCMAVWGGVR
jgi:hypothetical protein